MLNADFFDLNLANTIVWALCGLYVTGAAVVISLSVKLGNKKEAQKSSIYAIAERSTNLELDKVIISIIEENMRILMPTKTNWLLIILASLAAITALFTLFLAKPAQANPGMIGYWSASAALFAVFYGFASVLLWFEYKYVATLKRLQDKHEDGGKKVIEITVK